MRLASFESWNSIHSNKICLRGNAIKASLQALKCLAFYLSHIIYKLKCKTSKLLKNELAISENFKNKSKIISSFCFDKEWWYDSFINILSLQVLATCEIEWLILIKFFYLKNFRMAYTFYFSHIWYKLKCKTSKFIVENQLARAHALKFFHES